MEKFLSANVVVPGYSIAEHGKVSKCLCSGSGIFYYGANAVFAHRIKLYVSLGYVQPYNSIRVNRPIPLLLNSQPRQPHHHMRAEAEQSAVSR